MNTYSFYDYVFMQDLTPKRKSETGLVMPYDPR